MLKFSLLRVSQIAFRIQSLGCLMRINTCTVVMDSIVFAEGHNTNDDVGGTSSRRPAPSDFSSLKELV